MSITVFLLWRNLHSHYKSWRNVSSAAGKNNIVIRNPPPFYHAWFLLPTSSGNLLCIVPNSSHSFKWHIFSSSSQILPAQVHKPALKEFLQKHHWGSKVTAVVEVLSVTSKKQLSHLFCFWRKSLQPRTGTLFPPPPIHICGSFSNLKFSQTGPAIHLRSWRWAIALSEMDFLHR